MKFGIPETIHSDQGTEFVNDFLARINDRMNVGHKVTTPYYPQANAQVERFNRTLKESLKIYCEKKPGNWDKYISSICFAYNTSLNAATGFSPFYLMYGRHPRLPTEILQSDNYNEFEHDLKQYQIQLTSHLRIAYDLVRKRLEEEAVSRKINWDKKIKGHHTFNKDDLVLIFQEPGGRKPNELEHSGSFKRKWLGPYVVMEQRHQDNQDVYKVKELETERSFTVNVHRMIKYNKRNFLYQIPKTSLDEAPRLESRILEAEIPVSDGIETAGGIDTSVLSEAHRPKSKVLHESSTYPDTSYNSIPKMLNKQKGKVVSKQEQSRKKQREKEDLLRLQPASAEAIESFEIEKILDHKTRGKGYQYLIKWVGHSEPTWEATHMIDTTECLEEYWNKQPPKVKKPRKYRGRTGAKR
jgi:predicted nucleic acid-binding protein